MPKFPSSSIGRYTRISQVQSQYVPQNEIINLPYAHLPPPPPPDHPQSTGSCDKCFADFDTKEKKCISCVECDFNVCAPCYQTYLLEDPATASPAQQFERKKCNLIHCMKCKCKWNSSFVRKHTSWHFWRKQWPTQVANILRSNEQPRINQMLDRIDITEEYRNVFQQFIEINGRLNRLSNLLNQMPEIRPTNGEPIAIPELTIPEPIEMLIVSVIPELTRLYRRVSVSYSNTETMSIVRYIRKMNRLWLNFIKQHTNIQKYAESIGSTLYNSRELDAYVRGEINDDEFKKKLMKNHRTTAYGRDKLRVWANVCEAYTELITKLVEWIKRQRLVTNTDKLLSFHNSRFPHIRELITIANKEMAEVSMEHGMPFVEYFDDKFQGFTYLK